MRLLHFFRHILRSEWSGRIFGFVFLVAVCAAAYWAGIRHRDSGVTPDGLYIDPKYLDFGEVWEHTDFKWSIAIENSSAVPLQIQGWSSSSSCVDISPSTFSLPAGETVDLHLTLDLSTRAPCLAHKRSYPEGSGTRGRSTVKNGEESGIYSFSVWLKPRLLHAATGAPSWTLRGQVRKAFDLSEQIIDFGEEMITGLAFPTRTLHFKTRISADSFSARCETDLGSASLILNRGASSRHSVQIRPSSSLPLGPVRGKLRLTAMDAQGGDLAQVDVPILGLVVEAIEAVPPAILFSPQKIGTSATSVLMLRSRTSLPFTVEETHSGLRGSRISIERGRTGLLLQLLLKQEIAHSGDMVGALSIRYRLHGEQSARCLNVPVSYYGLPHQGN